jgi:hypothetical protein
MLEQRADTTVRVDPAKRLDTESGFGLEGIVIAIEAHVSHE